MPHADLSVLVERGAHVMTVCNACRYCEQYCPVFPAMERRMRFEAIDLAYLANLCHNCGECLYACQYAPPHEFGINVPHTLADLRLRSYEEYCWPRGLAMAFRRQGVLTALALAAAFVAALLVGTLALSPTRLWATGESGDFYAVISHAVMVVLFGGVFLFVIVAMAIGVARFHGAVHASLPVPVSPRDGVGRARPLRTLASAIRDAATLRHLQPGSVDCVSAEEERSPWRRWFHHLTFYGFALCFASTTIAAIYHSVFGWLAPYAYSSLPVVVGTLGGAGLLAGTTGLFFLRRERDVALGSALQRGLDESLLVLLFLTAATGVALLFLRHQPIMGLLLVLHLGIVLALFVTLPYGKFVHGFYRLAALAISAREKAAEETD
jgi:citrate/tricarballylate utilization protein